MEAQPVNPCPLFNRGKCMVDGAPLSKEAVMSLCMGDFQQCEKYESVDKLDNNKFVMPSIMSTDCLEPITCEFLRRGLISGPKCVYQCVAWGKFLTRIQLEKCIKYWNTCPIRKEYHA